MNEDVSREVALPTDFEAAKSRRGVPGVPATRSERKTIPNYCKLFNEFSP